MNPLAAALAHDYLRDTAEAFSKLISAARRFVHKPYQKRWERLVDAAWGYASVARHWSGLVVPRDCAPLLSGPTGADLVRLAEAAVACGTLTDQTPVPEREELCYQLHAAARRCWGEIVQDDC
jgi:hypothetical protein